MILGINGVLLEVVILTSRFWERGEISRHLVSNTRNVQCKNTETLFGNVCLNSLQLLYFYREVANNMEHAVAHSCVYCEQDGETCEEFTRFDS
jgi:hypothetical protein